MEPRLIERHDDLDLHLVLRLREPDTTLMHENPASRSRRPASLSCRGHQRTDYYLVVTGWSRARTLARART